MNDHLPSLHALRAFDAAARLGAFNKAAVALHITPTAVSHHIRALEDELGVKLFVRHTRKIALTPEGVRLAKACAASFSGLQDAVKELRKDQVRPMVRIALGPLLASRWLMPRLPQFWETFPEIDLNLLHSSQRIDPRTVEAEIYLVWGENAWPGMETYPLLKVDAVPVASPRFLKQNGQPEAIADLIRLPLIHQRSEAGWSEWFQNAGAEISGRLSGMVIEDANLVLRAALEGQGIALGWLPLIEAEVKARKLEPLFEKYILSHQRYCIAVSKNLMQREEVANIVNWLRSA